MKGFPWRGGNKKLQQKQQLEPIVDDPDPGFVKMQPPTIQQGMVAKDFVMHVSAFPERYTQGERDHALRLSRLVISRLIKQNERLDTALKVAARLSQDDDATPSASPSVSPSLWSPSVSPSEEDWP